MRKSEGGSGNTSTVVRKVVLPTPAVKYTPPPSSSSYYTNAKAITSKAGVTLNDPKKVPASVGATGPAKYSGQYLLDKNGRPVYNGTAESRLAQNAWDQAHPVQGPKNYSGQQLIYKTDANGRPIYNGTSTSRQAQNSWDSSHGYGGGSSSSSSGSGTGSSADLSSLAATAKLTDLWNQASGYKSQIDTMMKDGFSYDPTKDAAYQSLETLAQNNAKSASKNAMEDMNDRGILNSTIMGDRLGQIQQTAQDAVTAQVPNLQQAAYGRYMDKLNQLNNMWNSTVGQAQAERAYNFDVTKFNTDNQHWQQEFDYSKSQDAINNSFKQQGLELDRMNYTLKAMAQEQDLNGVNNTQATQAAIAELLGSKSADEAMNIMLSKAQAYYNGGVNFSQLMSALDKRWSGFGDKAKNQSVAFK
jgi:hypothetical protein